MAGAAAPSTAPAGSGGAPGARGTVLISGASSGIGRATALHLAARGHRVLAGVRRDEDGAALRAAAGDAPLEPVMLDVTDPDHIAALPARVGGPLAGLVNNAGVAVGGPLEYIGLEELRRQFEINVFGHIAVTQALLDALREGRGRIANVTSVGGRTITGFLGPYNASKWALEALGGALRQELRPWGIWVAAIEPGSIATEIWAKGESKADEIRARMPAAGLERYGATLEGVRAAVHKTAARAVGPEKVARAIEHALTARRPRARYVVGVDARMQIALQALLPARAWDALVLSQTRP